MTVPDILDFNRSLFDLVAKWWTADIHARQPLTRPCVSRCGLSFATRDRSELSLWEPAGIPATMPMVNHATATYALDAETTLFAAP